MSEKFAIYLFVLITLFASVAAVFLYFSYRNFSYSLIRDNRFAEIPAKINVEVSPSELLTIDAHFSSLNTNYQIVRLSRKQNSLRLVIYDFTKQKTSKPSGFRLSGTIKNIPKDDFNIEIYDNLSKTVLISKKVSTL